MPASTPSTPSTPETTEQSNNENASLPALFGTDTQLFGWQGLTATLPADWYMRRFEGTRDNGKVSIDDADRGLRFEFRMRKFAKMGWRHFTLWLGIVAIAAGRGAAQQPDPNQGATPTPTPGPITMQLDSPMALTNKPLAVQVRFGRWFPVAVTLSNRGEPVQGTLSLHLMSSGGSSGETSAFESRVDLPNVALKRIWIYGRYERGECDMAEVTLQGRGFTTVSQRFNLHVVDAATRQILTISDTDERMTYLGGLRGPGLGLSVSKADNVDSDGMIPPPYPGANGSAYPGSSGDFADASPLSSGSNQKLLQPLGASHEMIPDRWIGLETADSVVLQDFAHSTLSASQLAALRGYAAAGGELIVFGGANWQRLAQSPLADLWPIRPGASSVATTAETNELVNDFVTIEPKRRNGGDRLGGASVVLLRGTLHPDAELLEGTSAAPLVGSRRYGAGYIQMLAMDPTKPPFLGWSGIGGLWQCLFENIKPPNRLNSVDTHLEMPGYSPDSSGYNSYGYDYEERGSGPTVDLLQQIIQTPQLRTPPVSYIAWFLALYVFVLVPVNYCILRFFDRREWAWVTVPLIVIAFSAVSYAAALRIKGNMVRTRLVNIVQGSQGSSSARVDSMLWLFSPRRGIFTIGGTDPSMTVADYIDVRDDSTQSATIQQPTDNSFEVEDFPINMWDWKTFIGQSVVDLKQGARIEHKNNGLWVTNRTPFDLKGCVLVVDGKVRRCGDIAAGKSRPIQPVQASGIANQSSITGAILRESQTSQIFGNRTANNFNNIAQATLVLALRQQDGRPAGTEPLLIAWGQKALASLQVRGEAPRSEELSLFVLRLPNEASLHAAAPDNGWLPGRITSLTADPASKVTPSSGSKVVWPPRNLYYDVTLPRLATGKNWHALDLTLQGVFHTGRKVKNPNIPLEVALWDFGSQSWTPVEAQIKVKPGKSSARSFVVKLQSNRTAAFVRRPDPQVRLRVTARAYSLRLHLTALRGR